MAPQTVLSFMVCVAAEKNGGVPAPAIASGVDPALNLENP
jgi:hypothetical protein